MADQVDTNGAAPPRELEEEPPVEIHKPRPWHGFSEFLKEYLIIVVGVLTALAGEQLVERIHLQTEMAEAREALHAELADNAATARFVGVEVGCLGKQLDAFDAWAKGGPHPGPMRTSLPAYASSAWDIVKSGAVAHMPLKERLAYSRYYDLVDDSRFAIQTTHTTFRQIGAIGNHDTLTAEDARRLVEALDQARFMGRVRIGTGEQLIDKAMALKIAPNPYSLDAKEKLTRICDRPFEG